MSTLTPTNKIKAAIAAAITLDGATLVALASGTVTWHQALVAIIGLDLPVLAGYLKSE